MWNRQQVKEQAKQIMKRNYWKMFVVTLITGILCAEYVGYPNFLGGSNLGGNLGDNNEK